MKLEDAGPHRWGTRCANYWPLFVPLRPSLLLLWAGLTRSVGFAFRPRALADPTAIMGLISDMVVASHEA
jgi:hypothetical protein